VPFCFICSGFFNETEILEYEWSEIVKGKRGRKVIQKISIEILLGGAGSCSFCPYFMAMHLKKKSPI
jgi:hypothetical protein